MVGSGELVLCDPDGPLSSRLARKRLGAHTQVRPVCQALRVSPKKRDLQHETDGASMADDGGNAPGRGRKGNPQTVGFFRT